MKKINIIHISLMMLIPFLFIQPLKSAIYTDINGTYINLSGEAAVKGVGITFLWDMPRFFDNDNVLFYINSAYAYHRKNIDKPSETRLTYIPSSAGIEYRHQIFTIPLYITGSAGAGVSYFKKESPIYSSTIITPSKTQTDSDYGPYADCMLGLNYVFTQNAAIFVRGGYQISVFNSDKIESPKGYQFVSGLRLPIYGINKDFGGVEDVYPDSKPVRLKTRKSKNTSKWEFSPGVIIPIAKFSRMAEPGPGGMFSYMRNNIFFNGCTAGFEGGYFYINGKDSNITDGLNIYNFQIVPVAIKAGYVFNLTENFSVTPALSLGTAFISSSYSTIDKITYKENKKSSKAFDPMEAISLSINYAITPSFVIGIKTGYTVLIEKEMSPQFASCGITLGLRY